MAITTRTATVVEAGSSTAGTVSSITGTLPTDRQAGDLVIAVLSISAATTPSYSTPSGWTQLFTPISPLSGESFAAYYAFSPGSAPTITPTLAANRASIAIQAFGGVDSGTPFDATVVTTSASNVTTLVATGVTTTTANTLLVGGCMVNTSQRDLNSPAGMTENVSYDHTVSDGRAVNIATEARPTAGATGTRTWTWDATTLSGAAFLVPLRARIDATPTPSTVAAVASVPTTTQRITVTPATVSVIASVPTATAMVGPNADVPVAKVSAVSAVPTPTIVAIRNVTMTASVVAGAASVPSPTVTAGTGVTAPATVVTVASAVPSPVVTSPALVTPAVIGRFATVPSVGIDTTGVAKSELLVDRFSYEDTGKWSGLATSGVDIDLGKLAITVSTVTTTEVTSAFNYDLGESYVYIEAPVVQGTGSMTTSMSFGTASDHAAFVVTGGNITFRERVANVNSNVFVAYNATSDRWWRLSKTGTTLVWQTSPDGVVWTTRRTKTTTLALNQNKLTLSVSRSSAGSALTSKFDNLNLPAIVATPSGTPVENSGWWLEVYDVYGRELQTVVYDFIDMSFLDPIGEEGVASVSISRSANSVSARDPEGNIALLPNGNSPKTLYTQPYLWKYVDNGVRRFAAILENNDKPEAKPGDNDDTVSITGNGVATVLSWGIALPADLYSSAASRIFVGTNWATVWLQLLREAQTRGSIPLWVTPTFDEFVDSNGVAWPDFGDYEVKPGENLLALLKTFAGNIVFDWRMNPEGYLVAAQDYGIDRSATVVFHEGHDIWEAESHRVGTDVKSDVFIERGDGFITSATDVSVRTSWGHREVYVQSSSALGDQMGDIYAQGTLAQIKNPINERTFTINPNPVDDSGVSLGRRVYADYGSGDFIGYHQSDEDGGPESFKLISIALKIASDGTVQQEIIADAKREAFAERIRRLLQAQYGGNYSAGNGPGNDVTGGSTALDAAIGDTKVPGVVTITSVSSVSAMGDNGVEMADVTVNWDEPVNTDASQIVDGSHYELGYKLLASAEYTIVQIAWDQDQFTINGLVPNTNYQFRMRAVDLAVPANAGAWNSPTTYLTVIDTTAPPIPAAPSVAASYINVQITHDLGIFSGGTFNLPSDLDHLEVHAGTTFNFAISPTTLIGKLPANKGMLVGNIPAVGSFPIASTALTYFRVIAVDKSGNRSSASGSASSTALLIDNAHISDLTASKLTAGTVTAALILSGSIKTATTGARVEIDGAGIRAYSPSGTNTVNLSATTGNATITGDYATATAGQRIVIDSGGNGTIYFYPSTGSDYAFINAPSQNSIGVNSGDGGTANRTRLFVLPGSAEIRHMDGDTQAQVGGIVFVDVNQAQMNKAGGCSVFTNNSQAKMQHPNGPYVFAGSGSAELGTGSGQKVFALTTGCQVEYNGSNFLNVASSSWTLTTTGTGALHAGGSLNIDADSNLTIDALGTISITADSNLNVTTSGGYAIFGANSNQYVEFNNGTTTLSGAGRSIIFNSGGITVSTGTGNISMTTSTFHAHFTAFKADLASGTTGESMIHNAGQFYYVVSSAKVKSQIEDADRQGWIEDVLKLRPVTYYDKRQYEEVDGDIAQIQQNIGLIAEEVMSLRHIGHLLAHPSTVDPDIPYVDYRTTAVAMLPVIQDMYERLRRIEASLGI